jgi:hypothetical protein
MGAKLGSAGEQRRRTLPAALAAHCWRPGQSGNPGGHSGLYGEAIALARQAAPEAVSRLIELMRSDDERVAAVAANSILDRAFGRPRPAEDAPSEQDEIAGMSSEERRRELRELAAKILAGDGPVIDSRADEAEDGEADC